MLLHGDFFGINRPLAAFRLSSSQWSVHLARVQSGQVIGFHHRLAAGTPALLSTVDLWRGDAMARGMALVRRLAYLWLGRRTHVATPPVTTSDSGRHHQRLD
mgnify:CR=1 FL=1